jgi:hypothetical protein
MMAARALIEEMEPMPTRLIPAITVVNDSRWLNKDVTDHLGRPASVRRVYDVDGEHVAVLTSALPVAEGGEAICGEHVDLLATAEEPPAFPDFLDQRNQLAVLEGAVFRDGATEDDARRYRALADAIGRRQGAEARLTRALFSTAMSGDRVYLTGTGILTTIVDPDPRPEPGLDGVRLYVRARLDTHHLDENPHLARTHPDGIADLSTLTLFPTLGLI